MKGELITAAVLIVFFGAFLYVNSTGDHEWSGADSQAEGAIGELTGGSYEPWFEPIWEPPSGEIENLFFSLQAAIGGLIIGYFLGYNRRRSEVEAPTKRGSNAR
ncbi:MAG: energy-coupling factor ABC transporter substrate-binding protein [Methanotrichaceae archaeon]|nr:energy-coupling factor ABC transporter substrate-binding protein [Methanotrichaceae archaeon]